MERCGSRRCSSHARDNHDGTSIIFVTAEREDSQLQKMKQSTSVGVGPATLTMPSGSARQAQLQNDAQGRMDH
jgi:hypothetical protein